MLKINLRWFTYCYDGSKEYDPGHCLNELRSGATKGEIEGVLTFLLPPGFQKGEPSFYSHTEFMEICEYLTQNGIAFERFDHPPVYTCEEANRLIPDLPGTKTKNLFVRDRKGKNHFLIVVSDDKEVDLGVLAEVLGASRLSMGSPDRLRNVLGVEPGSVSILALYYDQDGAVQVVIDREVWQSEALQCHPMVNTATLVVSRDDLARFLEGSGHSPRVIDIPSKKIEV